MIDGEIVNADGTSKKYSPLGSMYYETVKFNIDWTYYIDSSLPKTGVYDYDEKSQILVFLQDGNMYSNTSYIDIISWKEMIQTIDYGTSGKVIKHYELITYFL